MELANWRDLDEDRLYLNVILYNSNLRLYIQVASSGRLSWTPKWALTFMTDAK